MTVFGFSFCLRTVWVCVVECTFVSYGFYVDTAGGHNARSAELLGLALAPRPRASATGQPPRPTPWHTPRHNTYNTYVNICGR